MHFWQIIINTVEILEILKGPGAPNDSFLLNSLKTLLGYPEYFLTPKNAF